MFSKFNIKGSVLLAGLTGFALVGSCIAMLGSAVAVGSVGKGLIQTAKDGTMKNNGKKIWCKMQNRGNDVCDQLYK
jgi:hypothetical protein